MEIGRSGLGTARGIGPVVHVFPGVELVAGDERVRVGHKCVGGASVDCSDIHEQAPFRSGFRVRSCGR